jgi:hypothetical protein
MTSGSARSLVLLIGPAVLACQGCATRNVSLVFHNATDEAREVRLTAPTHGTVTVGTVRPGGKSAGYNLVIARAVLPAVCLWRADGTSGEFVVTDDSPDELSFVIEQPPPPTSQPTSLPATTPATRPASQPTDEPRTSPDTRPL